jgi:hypothetical protein
VIDENYTSSAPVAVYTFDISEVVVDAKGAIWSQPFEYHLAGRKYDTNGDETNPAYPAFVVMTQQFKDSHFVVPVLHNPSYAVQEGSATFDKRPHTGNCCLS